MNYDISFSPMAVLAERCTFFSMFIRLAWARWIPTAVFMDMRNAEHANSRFWDIVGSKMACCHIRLCLKSFSKIVNNVMDRDEN